MRLIDAYALEDEFGVSDADLIAKEVICNAPTVDAVPVTRCEYCKYSYNITGKWRCSHGICCGRAVPPNFYCAEGKQKES